MKLPGCSIVIRARNEEKHIARLLEGIARQTVPDVEIILVDSGSTDRTLAIAAQYPVQVVHIQPEEFTFGYSLNRGVSQARAELVVIASAHVYPVYPDWLKCLLAPFSNQGVALTYGKQRGSTLNKFSEQQVFRRWYPEVSQPRQLHPFCNNANAAIRRSVWENDRYNETIPALEDLEWAQRILAQGHALSYVAEAEVVHIHEESPQAVYNRYRREAMAFKRLFPHERYHLWNLAHNLTTNIVNDVRHAAGQHLLGSRLAEIFWFRWMQFWGTYKGYHQPGPLTWQLRQTFYYPGATSLPASTTAREIPPIQYSALGETHAHKR